MNKNTSKIKGFSGVGVSWLLVIFVLLALVSFGVLSLAGAGADKRLSDKTMVHSQQYFAASNAANERLSTIDEILTKAYKNENYFSAAKTEIAKLDEVKIADSLEALSQDNLEAENQGGSQVESQDNLKTESQDDLETYNEDSLQSKNQDSIQNDNIENSTGQNGFYAGFHQPISDSQYINVIIYIKQPESDQDNFYKIKAFQTVTKVAWQPNESLPVYKPKQGEK